MVDRRYFYSPEAEIAFYLPEGSHKFLALGVYSPLTRQWVPLVFSANRELLAGLAARLAEGGLHYWAVPFESDDEARELSFWRSLPAPDSDEFRAIISQALGVPGTATQ